MLWIKYVTGDVHAPFGPSTVYKGGGGGTQTTTSGIDEEFKPYLERVLSDVTDRYESEVAAGPDAIVAKMTPEQQAAMDAQKGQAQDMMAGTGIFDTQAETQRQLANLQGRSMVGQAGSGSLGSARSQRATQAALADMGSQFAEQRQQQALAGSQLLGDVGSAKQQYDQARLDAPHTSASRYFGYLAGAPQTTKTTQSSGGGK